jgi:hypothetical protein
MKTPRASHAEEHKASSDQELLVVRAIDLAPERLHARQVHVRRSAGLRRHREACPRVSVMFEA